MARPTKYKPEYIEQAKHLCKLGATTLDLANAFSVTSKTIESWMKSEPEFLRTIKETKQDANEIIKQSLFSRARGYSHDDMHVSNFQGIITLTPITKHYAPDVTACMAWLHNRDPDNWKPRKAAEDDKDNTQAINVTVVKPDGID